MERTRKNNNNRIPADPLEVVPVEFKRGLPPTKYDSSIAERTLQLAQLGLTIAQIAMAVNVPLTTMKKWLVRHPQVRKAYEDGKYQHDFGIELTLKRKAEGFTVPEVKHYSGVDSLGREWERTVTTEKYYPPDTTALIFWLKNRNSERWRDAYRLDQNNQVNVSINKTLNLGVLTEDEQKMLEGVALKQIINMNTISDAEVIDESGTNNG